MKELSAKELHKAYRATFGTEYGKAVLESLKAAIGFSRPSFTPGDSQFDTVWKDGRKSVILLIEHHLSEPDAKPEVETEETA